MRVRALQKEQGHVQRLRLCCLKITGVSSCNLDLNRSNFLSSDQSIEVQQPLLAKCSNVQINTIQGSERANRIRSIFEHTRGLNDIRRLKELSQRSRRNIVVELFIVFLPIGNLFLTPSQRLIQSWPQAINRIHRSRIIDVIGGDKRSIERSRTRSMEQLKNKATRFRIPIEDSVDPEVLCPHIRTQVFPLRILRIRRRLYWIRPNMAEGA